MLTNEGFSKENNYQNPYAGTIGIAALMAPVGAGGVYAYQSLQANLPISSESFGIKSPVGKLGHQAGDALRRTSAISKAKRKKAADDFAKKMVESKNVQGLLKQVQDQYAVIQSMLSSLDDPEAGISSTAALGFKQRLENAAQDLSKESDIKDTLVALFSEMYDNNNQALDVFRGRLREYKKVGSQLRTPTFQTTPSNPFVKIESNLTAKAKSRLGDIRNVLKRYSNFNENDIGVYQVTEDDGVVSQYLRVYAGSSKDGTRRLLTTVPLHLNIHNEQTERGYNVIRSGARATKYTSDRRLIDASRALSALQQYGSISEENLRKAGAILDIEDFYIDRFNQKFKGGSRIRSADKYNQEVTEVLTHEPRYASMPNELGSHLKRVTRLQSNTARFLGLEALPKEDRLKLLKAASASDEYDLGSGPDRLSEQNINGRMSMAVLMREGSAFNAMRTGFGSAFKLDRFTEPIVGRLEQVWNRSSEASVYLTSNKPLGRGGVFSSGATNSKASNILWDNELTGGANRGFLLDVGKGKLWRGLEGKGLAYSTAPDIAIRGITIPVADPTAHSSLSSELLNKVMAAEGAEVQLTREEIKKYKKFLAIGTGPENRFLPLDPRTQSISLRYQETTKSAGNQAIHLLATVTRVMDSQKIFSREFKGSVDQISGKKARNLLAGYGLSESELAENFGMNIDQAFLGSGEMYKKSLNSWFRQLGTSYAMVTGDNDFEASLNDEVLKLKQNKALGLGLLDSKNDNDLALATVATMRKLKERGVSAKTAGHVMALVYNRGLNNQDSWLKGNYDEMMLSGEAFNKLATSLWGNSINDFLTAASSGLVVTGGTYTQGQGVGDWGRARASIEPRFIEMLQQKLRTTGMSESKISSIITNIVSRKTGINNQIELVDELTEMMSSMKGLGTKKASATRHTVNSLIEAINSGGFNSLNEFLEKQEGGVLLSFSDNVNEERSNMLRNAAKKVIGSDEIYLSGKTAIDAMRGTFIKTTGNDLSIDIGNDYERILKAFGENLKEIGGRFNPTQEEIESGLIGFNENMTGLTAKSFQQLISGQIKGSAFLDSYAYDLDENTNLSTAQSVLVKNVMTKTKSQAVFVDTAGFLSQLEDFSGSNSKNHVAQTLERFFTGLEGDNIIGIGTITSRNPILSVGGVAATETFRDVKEVGLGAADPIFQEISNTEWGKKALSRFGDESVTNWSDVARSKNKKAKALLFRDFSKNLGSFAGTGGGKMYYPVKKSIVTFANGKSLGLDIGLAEPAGADMDGDKIGHYLLDRLSSQRLIRHNQAKDTAKLILQEHMKFNITKATYVDQAKVGLNNFARKMGRSLEDIAYQDALKEKASKEATGIVDDALNDIRRSVLNYGGDRGNSALALLDVLEEHTTIKGKKVPIYYPFAEQLASSVTQLIKTGNADAFNETINFIFQGSDLLNGAFEVSGISGDEGLAGNVTGIKINLQQDLELIRVATLQARESFSRGSLGATAKRIASMISYAGNDIAQRFNDLFWSDSSFQAGIVNSGRETGEQIFSNLNTIANQVGSFLDTSNRKAMGGLVLGVAGAMAAGAMISPGYSPEPIMMESEYSPEYTSDPMIDPSNISSANSSYDMMQRPLQPATTYMQKNNTYQMYSEANNSSSFSGILGYLGSAHQNSYSTIAVNDMRLPITSSYIDRLSGEY